MLPTRRALVLLVLALIAALPAGSARADDPADEPIRRLLYVAVPGIRNYLEYGGHGLLVFDIDDGHRFLKRIPTGGLNPEGEPINVKGICASAITDRLYISTITTLQCLDLKTEQILWEIPYESGCDRMSLSPDGKTLYLPSFEKAHWHVVDALSGEVIAKIVPDSASPTLRAFGRTCSPLPTPRPTPSPKRLAPSPTRSVRSRSTARKHDAMST
jgi:hypothetical protein